MEIELFYQLLLATFLGALIGIEREIAGKSAGIRTYSLVSLGSTLFSLMSKLAFIDLVGQFSTFDPSRIAAQVVVGVGFIGAGSIMFNKSKVHGLTTAAGLWVSAAIGMTVAYNFYLLAIFSTMLTLLIFVLLWYFDAFLKPFRKE